MSKVLMFIYKNSGATFRKEIVAGIEYIIVPAIVLVEGILNGFFLPADEIANIYEAWEGTEISINHPEENGGSVKAIVPDVQIVGRFIDVFYDKEKKALGGDFWIVIDELNKTDVGKDIYENIKKGNILEVSTGFYAEFDFTEGMFEGDDYYGVHRSLRPDHIAILPGSTGACSIDDGCGLGRNKKKEDCPKTQYRTMKLNLSSINKENNRMKRKIKWSALKKLLPFLNDVEVDDEETEVEIDSEALLTDDQKEKLDAEPVEGEPLPEGVTEMLEAFKEVGGKDGLIALRDDVRSMSGQIEQNKKTEEEQRKEMLKNILATKQDAYSEEELKALETPALIKVHSLTTGKKVVNYVGASPAHNEAESGFGDDGEEGDFYEIKKEGDDK